MVLYLQCTTGVSGDMFLSGLADLGLDLIPLQTILHKAELDLHFHAEKAVYQGLQGSRLIIEFNPDQTLRRLQDILILLEKLEISPVVKEKTQTAFDRLACVEAEVHGVSKEQVHFHEI